MAVRPMSASQQHPATNRISAAATLGRTNGRTDGNQ